MLEPLISEGLVQKKGIEPKEMVLCGTLLKIVGEGGISENCFFWKLVLFAVKFWVLIDIHQKIFCKMVQVKFLLIFKYPHYDN